MPNLPSCPRTPGPLAPSSTPRPRGTLGKPARMRRSFALGIECLEQRTALSTLTVTSALDQRAGSLRDTITKAKSGDTIVFAPSLDGQTITLTSDQLTINNSLDIKGPGANLLTISGNGTNRIFDINEGLNVAIDGLTLTQGRAIGGNGNGGRGAGGGGAILNVGSVVSLANDVVADNVSLGTSGDTGPKGGAIANYGSGSLTVTDSHFVDNRADGSVKDSGWAEGGAIFSELDGPSVTATRCAFIDNQAIAGNGGVLSGPSGFGIGDASGGAVHVEGMSSTLTAIDCTFTGNRAIAGSGSSAQKNGLAIDSADGGAIVCHDGANLVVGGSTFTDNAAVGGSNASGVNDGGLLGTANGGAVDAQGVTTITNSQFIGNQAIGGNGNTAGSGIIEVGVGSGGAINASGSSLSVGGSKFAGNQAVGGAGNTGGILAGDGGGGGIMTVRAVYFGSTATVTATVTGTTFTGNQAIGGAGTDGLGGALANVLGASLTVSGGTLAGDQAVGGAGSPRANGGNGLGGGVYDDGQSTLTILGTTITGNQADGGAAGAGGAAGFGKGGGAYFAAGGFVGLDPFTTITGNTASTDDNNVFGAFTTP